MGEKSSNCGKAPNLHTESKAGLQALAPEVHAELTGVLANQMRCLNGGFLDSATASMA